MKLVLVHKDFTVDVEAQELPAIGETLRVYVADAKGDTDLTGYGVVDPHYYDNGDGAWTLTRIGESTYKEGGQLRRVCTVEKGAQ